MNVAAMSLTEKLGVVLKKAASRLPVAVGRRLLALVSPSALATMGVVVTIWAGSHFFGVGEIADAILLVVGYVSLGGIAVEAGKKLLSFAVLTKSATSEHSLDQAGEALAAAISMIGVDGTMALLLREKPEDTFGTVYKPDQPLPPFAVAFRRPLPRSGEGLFYKPTIRFTRSRMAGEGGTKPYGDTVIGRDFFPEGKSASEAFLEVKKTAMHEAVHRFLAPKMYLLREPRLYMHLSAYKRSFILRYVEESVAETVALLRTEGVGKDQVLQGFKFPFGNKYQISVVSLRAEAAGILLGPINVGGMIYHVYYGLEE